MRRKRSSGRNESPLEEQFMEAWKHHFPTLPLPERQHQVLNPYTDHFWKLDFAWPGQKVLVEIQGWGRHTRLPGQAKDYLRQNYLTSLGWRCLFFNSINLKDMEEAVNITAMVLCNAR